MATTYRHVQRVRLRQVRDGRVRFKVDQVNQPSQVVEAVRPFYKGMDREMMSVLCLSARNEPLCFSVIAIGDLNTVRTSPREVFKIAVTSNALSLILIHNHPSGAIDFSPEDIEFTTAIRKAGEVLGIELFDHVVITDDAFASFRERGLL